MGATVYAIAGGKGGVGKTTTAANLGAALRATGLAVALVDADLAMPNLQGFIGRSHEPTLHEVLGGTASLAEACVERISPVDDTSGRLDLYPGSQNLEAYGNADPDQLEDAVGALAEDYETLILDTGTGLTRDVTIPLQLADSTIIVTTPAEAAVADARKTMQLVTHLGGTVEGVVVSRTCGGLSDAEISERLGIDRLTTVPGFAAPARDILTAYRQLVVRLLVGTDVSPEAADILTGDPQELAPVFVSRIMVNTGAADAAATRARHDSPNSATTSTESDAVPASDGGAAVDDVDEDTTERVPGWFGGMVD